MRFHLSLGAAALVIAVVAGSPAVADSLGSTPNGPAPNGSRAAPQPALRDAEPAPRVLVPVPMPTPRPMVAAVAAPVNGPCGSLLCPKFVLLGTGF